MKTVDQIGQLMCVAMHVDFNAVFVPAMFIVYSNVYCVHVMFVVYMSIASHTVAD